jgi:hypothetical protein
MNALLATFNPWVSDSVITGDTDTAIASTTSAPVVFDAVAGIIFNSAGVKPSLAEPVAVSPTPLDVSATGVNSELAGPPAFPVRAAGSFTRSLGTRGKKDQASITTAALGPISNPLCESGSENSRASDVDAGSGKSAPKKVETIGKDCNADVLAVRAVIYPAPRGASHGAPIPESTHWLLPIPTPGVETSAGDTGDRVVSSPAVFSGEYIPEPFSAYATRRSLLKVSPPRPVVERNVDECVNLDALEYEILHGHPRDLDDPLPRFLRGPLPPAFERAPTRSIIESLLKVAGVRA